MIYADDLYSYRTKKDVRFSEKLNKLYDRLLSWGNYSGVKISEEKCKLLHICKQINCIHNYCILKGSRLDNVKNLKVLGLIFNDKYKYN